MSMDYLIKHLDTIDGSLIGEDLSDFNKKILFLYNLSITSLPEDDLFNGLCYDNLKFLLYNFYFILGKDYLEKFIIVLMKYYEMNKSKSVIHFERLIKYINSLPFNDDIKIKIGIYLSTIIDGDINKLYMIQKNLLTGLDYIKDNRVFAFNNLFNYIIFWEGLDEDLSKELKCKYFGDGENYYNSVVNLLVFYFSKLQKVMFTTYLNILDNNSREIVVNFIKNENKLIEFYNLYKKELDI